MDLIKSKLNSTCKLYCSVSYCQHSPFLTFNAWWLNSWSPWFLYKVSQAKLTNKKVRKIPVNAFWKYTYPNLELRLYSFQCKNVFQWEEGDFIISDNLAVGHEATRETQLPRDDVGLRVLHRTTIMGTVPPAK